MFEGFNLFNKQKGLLCRKKGWSCTAGCISKNDFTISWSAIYVFMNMFKSIFPGILKKDQIISKPSTRTSCFWWSMQELLRRVMNSTGRWSQLFQVLLARLLVRTSMHLNIYWNTYRYRVGLSIVILCLNFGTVPCVEGWNRCKRKGG